MRYETGNTLKLKCNRYIYGQWDRGLHSYPEEFKMGETFKIVQTEKTGIFSLLHECKDRKFLSCWSKEEIDSYFCIITSKTSRKLLL